MKRSEMMSKIMKYAHAKKAAFANFSQALTAAWAWFKAGMVEVKARVAKVTYEIGNQTTTTEVTAKKEWVGGSNSRIYFTMKHTGKETKALEKLYLIQKGSSRDWTVEVNGMLFGYDAPYEATNSHTKKSSLRIAATELATILAESFSAKGDWEFLA